MDRSRHSERGAVVLVEGPSDAAALEAMAASHVLRKAGQPVRPFRVVSMGGVTNIGHFLAQFRSTRNPIRLAGLCDAPEERFFLRALRREGFDIESRQDMESNGFFVCERDLEEELIRAVGPDTVVSALADVGQLDRFRRFQRQPEWRDRDIHDQLHRFAGEASGLKIALAARLAANLTPATTPLPLLKLLSFVDVLPRSPQGPAS